MTQLILKGAPIGDNLEDYSVLEAGVIVGLLPRDLGVASPWDPVVECPWDPVADCRWGPVVDCPWDPVGANPWGQEEDCPLPPAAGSVLTGIGAADSILGKFPAD